MRDCQVRWLFDAVAACCRWLQLVQEDRESHLDKLQGAAACRGATTEADCTRSVRAFATPTTTCAQSSCRRRETPAQESHTRRGWHDAQWIARRRTVPAAPYGERRLFCGRVVQRVSAGGHLNLRRPPPRSSA